MKLMDRFQYKAEEEQYSSRKRLLVFAASTVCLLLLLIATACSINLTGGGSKPPIPIIQSEAGSIKVYQSSYCWVNECADYPAPNDLLKDNAADPVLAGEKLTVKFKGNGPEGIGATLFQDSEPKELPTNGFTFQAPEQPGTYYIGLDGRWSKGQSASYAIKVEVE